MTRSVLLIDDDVQVLGLLEKAFSRVGYSVMSATRGAAGVALYARDASDPVVLDLNLPDRSGIEVIGAKTSSPSLHPPAGCRGDRSASPAEANGARGDQETAAG